MLNHALIVYEYHMNSERESTRLRRKPSEPCLATKDTDMGRFSCSPNGMLTCQGKTRPVLNLLHKKYIDLVVTWHNPETPAMDNKLKALLRKDSSATTSAWRCGGGPGTVGITNTPLSFKTIYIFSRWIYYGQSYT